jgi:putative transcriptional regulator
MQLKRLHTGLSQEEFAAKIGVSRRTISVVERRLSDPSVRLALTIARALDTTVEEIFTEGPAPSDERPASDLDPYELRQQFLDARGVGIARGA